MSGGGGKGGSDTVSSEVKLPGWLEDAAKSNLKRADAISQIGYVPNYGPQVAAMSPMQEAAFANTRGTAGAFGMGGGGGDYLPKAETFANGVKGYNTWDLAQENIDTLKEKRPGQHDAITGMFIDPVTGEGGTFSQNSLTGNGKQGDKPRVKFNTGNTSGGFADGLLSSKAFGPAIDELFEKMFS